MKDNQMQTKPLGCLSRGIVWGYKQCTQTSLAVTQYDSNIEVMASPTWFDQIIIFFLLTGKLQGLKLTF